jgi:hypothetical protein
LKCVPFDNTTLAALPLIGVKCLLALLVVILKSPYD